MKKVFISGPYSSGDVVQNVKLAMDTASFLIDIGVAPFCHHLSYFIQVSRPQPYEKWMSIGLEFLDCCDVLLRLPGASSGADREVEYAMTNLIPVVHSIEELKQLLREELLR